MNWDDDDRELLQPANRPSAAVLTAEIVGLRVTLALIWERVMELAPPDWRPWVDETASLRNIATWPRSAPSR